ncbi:hypothetical protein [Streptacidiphilus sp. P02-A3a]|uniref:hypothetical protein n=1 Tax=Streptacidiphilus sp. P02-A3a TaxID=2704468 RepID=UPI0015FE56E5|nr:hypothetical protein [Streptacidiphilus sp. P02-A3a]QMU70247.1 hypothetical protein GXP74_20520 [Streptacidiphilus sp. P02-A3a]QMU70297.1 hypothetical protein GXP74_20855 [Streptacidiphilus sp. P02-A3a]
MTALREWRYDRVLAPVPDSALGPVLTPRTRRSDDRLEVMLLVFLGGRARRLLLGAQGPCCLDGRAAADLHRSLLLAANPTCLDDGLAAVIAAYRGADGAPGGVGRGHG